MHTLVMGLGQGVVHNGLRATIRTRIGILQSLETLEQLNDDIACFRECVLFCFIDSIRKIHGD